MNRRRLARIFPLGPDSRRQPGVPRGRLEAMRHGPSRVYPGTVRDWWIYVPAQYRASRPACLLVVQDGGAHLHRARWDMRIVLDNLIQQGAMPVTIGVFIDPGQVPAARPGGPPRDNRSCEYDSMDGRYARFLLEEILPEVERRYRLRPDGNSRAIMGGSSGGFCAFNAAWERPDRFQRVISMVGSFTPMRGGHGMAARVRLTPPKPLKVFLEGGAQDLDVACGHWWSANQDLHAALRYAGYDVACAWDERAGHNEFHTSMVCPQALRWLWQDYPGKVRAGAASRQPIAQVLAPQAGWQAEGAPTHAATVLAADEAGRLCFAAAADASIRRRDEAGRTTVLARGVAGVAGLAVGADGAIYCTQPAARRLLRVRGGRPVAVVARGIAAHGLAIGADGAVYVAEPIRGRIWRIAADGAKRIVATGLKGVRALAFTPPGGELLAAPAAGGNVWQLTVTADGGLAHAQPYHRLCCDEGAAARRPTALVVTRPGWACIATEAGLQFNLPNGLVAGFMAAPGPGGITGLALTGPRRDRLCVACGGRIFRRRIRLLKSLWL